MCDRLPSKNHRDLMADVPQRARDVPARRQRLTVDDLRRLAEACRDLDDPAVMARAWDHPHDTGEGMRAAGWNHETAPAMKHPQRFGQLPNLAVPDTVEIHSLTRKSMHGKAIHPLSLLRLPPSHTVAKRHCDKNALASPGAGRMRWRSSRSTRADAAPGRRGTVRHAEVVIANRSRRGDERRNSAQNQ